MEWQGHQGSMRKLPLVGQTHKPPIRENLLPKEGRKEIWKEDEESCQASYAAGSRVAEDSRS